MRALIIGTGSIGRRHMASLRGLVPAVRFDILREGRPDRGDEPSDVSICTSLDQALERRPDLMVIANPTALHRPYVLAAIDHGMAFYLEKPAVASAADLAAVRERVAIVGRLPPSMVGCNLRLLPSLQGLHRMVADGILGRVVHADFEAGQWLPDWRPATDYRQSYSARQALGGGVLRDLVHEVDSARWILGEFDRVETMTTRRSRLEIETEDCACLMMRARTGVLATVRLDYVSRRPFRRYRIVGDEGTAEWDLPARTLTIAGAESVRIVDLPGDAFDVAATYPAAMRELLDAMAAGRETSQPLLDGLLSAALVCDSETEGKRA